MITLHDVGVFFLVLAIIAALWFLINFGKYIIRWDRWKDRRRKR